MPCTTVLVGKKAANDNSTMIARTDDGHFDVKKLIVVEPKDQKKTYTSEIGHLTIELPDNPLRYTACPSVDPKNGIWAATGINAANVGMTATETITSNPRVLSADPLVKYQKAKTKKEKDVPGGIGEEDIVVLVLPYSRTAREGVLRLAALLEQYGTYESNGIAFNDENEIWWMETIGGHHWMAKRVPDDVVVVMPNQFGMDSFTSLLEGSERIYRSLPSRLQSGRCVQSAARLWFAFRSGPRLQHAARVVHGTVSCTETVPLGRSGRRFHTRKRRHPVELCAGSQDRGRGGQGAAFLEL